MTAYENEIKDLLLASQGVRGPALQQIARARLYDWILNEYGNLDQVQKDIEIVKGMLRGRK